LKTFFNKASSRLWEQKSMNFNHEHNHNDHEDRNAKDQQENSKECHLWLLPHDLFPLLSEYIVGCGNVNSLKFNDDWQCLMNTSKAYFADLKKQTRYIVLKRNSCHFLDDPLFRERILSLVNDPSLQICCQFQVLGNIGKGFDTTVLCNLNRVRILKSFASSFSLFKNVENLYLRVSVEDYLSDFNCFAGVKKEISIIDVKVSWALILDKDLDGCPTCDLSCLSPTLESLCLCVRRVANIIIC
jgi:hypothetical protein